LLSAIAALPRVVRVYSVRGLREPAARDLLLATVVRDAQADAVDATLYIEHVEGLERNDQATITRSRTRRPALTWHHLAPSEDPVLWVSDPVAWAIGAGASWSERVAPVIASMTEVEP
jgi:hypothetical protein